mmetsp:Transcript_18444/g.38632  ORF Transcript_18444/g.38632 Transcript_18444/m.38632 type:complete len:214 (+) Transcript_18444:2402-3043(+)
MWCARVEMQAARQLMRRTGCTRLMSTNSVNRGPLRENRARKARLDRMIRVDHAGERGAAEIYAGQLAVLGSTRDGDVIREMKEQEQRHLEEFERLIRERRVRPTVLMPVWRVAGFSLGMVTGLIGREAAMACTVAVEEVIADHYNRQVRELLIEEEFADEEDLRATFREFRDDEMEHKETGLAHDAEQAPMYRTLSSIIKAGCYGAIWVSERI